MSEGSAAEATLLLEQWQAGDDQSRDRLFAVFYPRMHRAAANILSNAAEVSLSPGDLVHEAVIRLVKPAHASWKDRSHFLAVAAKAMRHALIDHLRAKQAGKRDHCRVTLVTHLEHHPHTDFRELHHTLLRLSALDPHKAEIVEMRYFGGMSIADVAEVTGLSPSTVKKRWAIARAWMVDAMENSV